MAQVIETRTAAGGRDGTGVHPADAWLPLPNLFLLGLQHVLVLYAGAVAVPLIVGGAAGLSKGDIAFLINADLFACGVATLIQSIGFPGFGIRLPVMMGVTFAAVSPMIAMATNPDLGLLSVFGAVIVAGVFTMLIAPFVGRLLPLFPPVVTGTIIAIIGITLMGVGIGWAGGGATNPEFGHPRFIGMALFVLLVILAIIRFGSGFLRNISVLTGLVVGTAVAALLGGVDVGGIETRPWLAVVMPFHFGVPRFDVVAGLTMCIVMLVVMIESTGMFLALGEICERPVDQKALTRGLRTDGLGTLIGGVFNTFPYTSFSQNVGLVQVTGVRTRWVTAMGGLILIALGLVPKLAFVVASVPQYVLGGAGLVMFGMVAATGIKILGSVDFKHNRDNLFIVAVSVSIGLIPVMAKTFFDYMPKVLGPLLHSGILLGSVAAVLLNVFLNGPTPSDQKVHWESGEG